MELFISRITAGAILLILALISFVIQIFARKWKIPAPVILAVGIIGAVIAVYSSFAPLKNFRSPTVTKIGVFTSYLPSIAVAVILVLHYIALALFLTKRKNKPVVIANLTAAIALSVKLVLDLINFIRNWEIFSRGQPEIYYIQICITLTVIISFALFWISYIKSKKQLPELTVSGTGERP